MNDLLFALFLLLMGGSIGCLFWMRATIPDFELSYSQIQRHARQGNRKAKAYLWLVWTGIVVMVARWAIH
ncbi:hypothetical protein [Roseateles asaccharophilus]|uniref:Uncharacterized protein n=1 Tax=Roseateles asaccharophilus TaxID=582607 RepID=A0ABU2A1R1_9BURK|nr:hypothetical protein [Roseateles asaccharophilus]MDR7331129.1 hypothetical protein [Roseateles asaccharophilus]